MLLLNHVPMTGMLPIVACKVVFSSTHIAVGPVMDTIGVARTFTLKLPSESFGD